MKTGNQPAVWHLNYLFMILYLRGFWKIGPSHNLTVAIMSERLSRRFDMAPRIQIAEDRVAEEVKEAEKMDRRVGERPG